MVAGILMSRFGRSTSAHSRLAAAMVASVSKASPAATSIETRPSTPSVAFQVSCSTSQALRTSVVVTSKITSSTSLPAAVRLPTCSS